MDMTATHKYHGTITPARLAKMCEARSPEDVADDLKMTVAEVMAILDEVPSAQKQYVPVTVYCLDTGRAWNARGWQGAYLLAQLRGLSDWGWCRSSDYQAWQEAQA